MDPRFKTFWVTGLLLALLTDSFSKAQTRTPDNPDGGREQEMRVTFAPWTGTANPWTGTASPWTGTANPYTGPVHPVTKDPNPTTRRRPTRRSTPTPTPVSRDEGEQCYYFNCNGYYDECYRLHKPTDVCSKKGRFCKVSVYQDRNGSISVNAACVRRNCQITQGPGVTYGCCDSHLCNNEHLLTFGGSSAPPSPRAIISTGVVLVMVVELMMRCVCFSV